MLVSLVYGNFLVKVSSIPIWIQWMHKVSIIGYAFRIMVINEVAEAEFNFDVSTSKHMNIFSDIAVGM